MADAWMVLAETGDASRRGERLERAVAEAERGGRPLVLAGRHCGPRRARAPLRGPGRRPRAARAGAADLRRHAGRAGFRGPAHDELAATGVRPVRPRDLARHRLTPSELRTARLAADGLTNRDIALALFVTPKTVETHLRSAFRKLGVSSRRELPDALAST
jgi:DNA-binding CsgD family transcriptional regulator